MNTVVTHTQHLNSPSHTSRDSLKQNFHPRRDTQTAAPKTPAVHMVLTHQASGISSSTAHPLVQGWPGSMCRLLSLLLTPATSFFPFLTLQPLGVLGVVVQINNHHSSAERSCSHSCVSIILILLLSTNDSSLILVSNPNPFLHSLKYNSPIMLSLTGLHSSQSQVFSVYTQNFWAVILFS